MKVSVIRTGQFVIEDAPIPDLKPQRILLKVKAVQESITLASSTRGLRDGRIAGHEFSGEVAEVGKGVTGYHRGDRICVPDSDIPCGECVFCKAGKPWLCRSAKQLGGALPGAFAEYVSVPANLCYRIPENVSYNEAALMQPFISCLTGIFDVGLKPGESVVVLGQGTMGGFTMQLARATGAGIVVVSDVRDECLEISRKLGADVAIDAKKEDPVAKVLELTDGIGANIVAEAAGGPARVGLSGTATYEQALMMTAPFGTLLQIAGLPEGIMIDPNVLRRKCIKYVSHSGGFDPFFIKYGLRLLSSGRATAKPYVTQVLKGLENVPKAFEMMANKEKYKAIQVQIEP